MLTKFIIAHLMADFFKTSFYLARIPDSAFNADQSIIIVEMALLMNQYINLLCQHIETDCYTALIL